MSADALRQRATDEMLAREAQHAEEQSLSPQATHELLYELRVHQIELELQNEELRRTQGELELSRARYFDLYDRAPVGYLTIDGDGVVLEANLTVILLLGVAAEALVMQPWTSFIAAEDQDVYFRHRKLLAQSSAPQVCELRLSYRGGEPIWVRLEALNAPLADGAVASRTAVIVITDRKRAEHLLSVSAGRHRILFEESRESLVVLAPPSWQFTAVNAASIAMFKAHDEAELTSQALWDLLPELQPDGRSSKELALSMIAAAMSEGVHAFEWTQRRATGEEFRASVVLTRMDASGAPFLQGAIRDKTQAEKQRSLLAQTERLASIGLLAASVGHEINNPLTYVLHSSESLARTLPGIGRAVGRCCAALRAELGDEAFAAVVGDDARLVELAALAEASEHAEHALDGAQRIARISDALRTFSRVDAPNVSLVDVNVAIESAITVSFNQIRFRAQLVKELGTLPNVRASEGALSQVFLNILINASHAFDERNTEGQCIAIRTWAEGTDVFAEFKDNGKGIAPENLPRVFDPFFSTKRAGEGSGLGLAICLNTIVDLGGDIQVESVLGRGTRFVVRLPAAAIVLEPACARSAGASDPMIARGRILVVDDEERLRVLLRRLLCDHEVVLAASGKEAQALLASDRGFDLILCDVMMPEMTGVELHQWLVAHSAILAERVVFVTGGAFGTNADDYLQHVGNATLAKPFDYAALRRLASERARAAKAKGAVPVDWTDSPVAP
jgi:PAS domain S-box-containing protein